MGNEKNNVIRKLIQKIINQLLQKKEYYVFVKVDVLFVFGSEHKTAMCDYVYGIKIISKKQLKPNYLISSLEGEIQQRVNDIIGLHVCCTDIMYEKID
jgi:hypothetical protein